MICSFSATFPAVIPLMPESISSKISVGVSSLSASTVLIARRILESSPPETVVPSGFGGSPGFTEIKNSASSIPRADIFASCKKRISSCTSRKLRSSSPALISFVKEIAAFFRILLNFSAQLCISFCAASV